MRVLITGAAGRLGAELSRGLSAAGYDVVALSRTRLDICNPAAVEDMVQHVQPDVIANCSSYSGVDAAETDAASAFAVNADGPAILAQSAERAGALLVHYSTDFVFDGEATIPYTEDSPTNPLSVYGRSKLAGEDAVRRFAPQHYILRLESLFGGRGVGGQEATSDRIAENIIAGRPARAFVDRTVSPSYVPDVVAATAALISCGAASGVYHCVTSGYVTWFELAGEIAAQLGVPAKIAPAFARDVNTPAPRPRFCALANTKLAALGITLPSWQSAVGRHLCGSARDLTSVVRAAATR